MVGFPVLYPLMAAFMFELGPKGVLSIVLSPLFYLASVLWVMTGVGMQTVKHWSWYTFCASQVLATYFNALILINYSESDFKGVAFVVVLGLQYFVFYGVAREMRVPYLFPRINWWESGIAGIPHLGVELSPTEGGVPAQKGQLLDLSSRGCFIKTPMDYRLGDPIKLRLEAYGQEGSVSGRIVWLAASTVTHPKGIGVQFGENERSMKRKLRLIIRYFNQERKAGNGNTILPS